MRRANVRVSEEVLERPVWNTATHGVGCHRVLRSLVEAHALDSDSSGRAAPSATSGCRCAGSGRARLDESIKCSKLALRLNPNYIEAINDPTSLRAT
jgi:hypothetical protein